MTENKTVLVVSTATEKGAAHDAGPTPHPESKEHTPTAEHQRESSASADGSHIPCIADVLDDFTGLFKPSLRK